MNWKRIGSGALLAAAAMLAVDAIALFIQYQITKEFGGLNLWPVVFACAGYVLDGFFAAWLYAIMRPRLGPGPKTALVTGTAMFFIKEGLSILVSGRGVVWLLLLWFRLVLGSYLAGWQYIEKAP